MSLWTSSNQCRSHSRLKQMLQWIWIEYPWEDVFGIQKWIRCKYEWGRSRLWE
jgi:hypothetical protein